MRFSGNACSTTCKQQHHSKPLAQLVFKVFAFQFQVFNSGTKTRASLSGCCVNNSSFVPSNQVVCKGSKEGG